MIHTNLSVIKLGDVLLVTVPAEPDDTTISAMQNQVLQAMGQYETKGLVLDLSSVEMVDSFFARTLVETAQMVSLMGGRTAIAGMRPSVAITTVELGLQLGTIRAALDVDRAMTLLRNSKDEAERP